MANYGPWQALGEATNKATATGMGIMQYQAQRQDAANMLKLQQEQGARQAEHYKLANRKTELDIAEAEKKTRLLPLHETFKALGITNENEQNYLIKYAGPLVETSKITGKPVIQANYAQEVWERLQKDDKAQLDLAQMQGTNAAMAIEKIDADSKNPELKLKPEDIKRLQTERVNHVVEMTAAENIVRKLMKGTETKNITGVGPGGGAIRTPDVPGAAVYQKIAETPGQKLQRGKELAFYKESLKNGAGQAVQNFEMQHYGKLVPELRGSPEYVSKLYEAKKAGAMNINIAPEKFSIQKKATAGEIRTGLTTNKDDKMHYEANAEIFNSINTKNEVAYWDKGEGRFYDEETIIIKLSNEAKAAGWTPSKIQDAANAKGKTVQDVLKDIGVIK